VLTSRQGTAVHSSHRRTPSGLPAGVEAAASEHDDAEVTPLRRYPMLLVALLAALLLTMTLADLTPDLLPEHGRGVVLLP
jgi:hypothetical protein